MGLPIHDKDYFDVIAEAGTGLTGACFNQARVMGWHKEYEDLQTLIEEGVIPEKMGARLLGYYKATKLMLGVSELAEALEGDRKNLMDDKLPHFPMLGVELADCIIRCFDLGGVLGLDLGSMIAEKLRFNATRPDHQPAARDAEGGKTY